MNDFYLRDIARIEKLIDQIDKRVSDNSMSIYRAKTRLERIGSLVNNLSMTSSRHGAVIDRVIEMERDREARSREKARRQTVRKELLGLLQWIGAVLLFAATTAQIIGSDTAARLAALLRIS